MNLGSKLQECGPPTGQVGGGGGGGRSLLMFEV